MRLNTTRFGALEVPDDEIIGFPAGLPGFEDLHRYVILEDAAAHPFVWLQSLDQPELAFLCVSPAVAINDYQPDVSDEARQALRWNEMAAVEALAIVSVPDDPKLATVNLRAPLLLNRAEQLGRQEVGRTDRYHLRHPLFPHDDRGQKQVAVGR